MDEQGYRFGVGVLVVASLVIVIILILFFGAAPDIFARRYSVTINFDEAPGVETDTPVRKNGVVIGRVTNIKLLGFDGKGEDRGVDLTLELDSGKVQVQAGEVARIDVGSLITGDAVIEFVKDTPAGLLTRFDGTGGSPRDGSLDDNELTIAKTFLKEGDYMSEGAGQVAPDPLEAMFKMQDKLEPTLVAIQQATNQVNGLAQDIRRVIGSEQGGPIQQMARKAEMTMDNFNETLNAVESMFTMINNDATREALAKASERFPELLNEAQAVLTQTRTTIKSFEGVGSAAEETAKNVAAFTKPLGENGDRIVADAIRTLASLDQTLNQVRQIAARVNNSQGSLQKLIDDDQLYYSLVRTLENVEMATQRLQPIIEDVRIFSDKIARDPRQLGVKGAIDGRGVGLGVK